VVNAILTPGVGGGTVAWALAIVGLGFGMTLVTITSSVLTIVPPERSGMAASTVNTFRELGGVFGVAVLGAILNAQLTSHLTSRLRKLGIPANFRSLVIRQVTHGGAEKLHGAGGGRSGLVHQVISAAYAAFGAGLHLALLIAGSMLLAAAAVAFVAVRRPRTTVQRPEAPADDKGEGEALSRGRAGRLGEEQAG
jgi:hypothetical protein